MLGSALIVTIGGVGAVGESGLTATVADWVVLPLGPVHVNIYLAVALRGPVDSEPVVAIVPLQAPDAEQEVALVELHDSTADWPEARVAGLGNSDTVGLDRRSFLNLPALRRWSCSRRSHTRTN